MKVLFYAAGAIGLVVALAVTALSHDRAGFVLDPPAGDPAVIELLSGIEYVPSRQNIEAVLSGDAEQDLIAIARSDIANTDPGLRIRAYRALALFPSEATSEALNQAITDHKTSSTGPQMVYLRTAVTALAQVDGPDALSPLASVLDHPSRDIRAAVATALGLSGAPGAISILRSRLAIETTSQVELAIADAIRLLEEQN